MICSAKNVWFVSELYWPSLTSTGFILTRIAEGITKDTEVSVLTGPPSYEDGVSDYKLKEMCNGVTINRVKMRHFSKNNFLMRLVRLLVLSWKLFFQSLQLVKKNAVVILVTTPVTSVFIGAFLKRFKKDARIIIVVHDIYPDNMVVAGIINQEGVLYKILSKVFFSALKRMDEIVVLGRDMQAILEQKGHSNIRIIENWAEARVLCEPHAPNSVCAVRDGTKFLFAGNIGRLQGMERLLDGIERTVDTDASFVFAGGGAMQQSVINKSKALPNGVVTYTGKYDRSEQLEILSSCDIGIVSLDSGMFGLGVPSKAYNIMAAGKPMLYIGDPGSELDLVIKDSDCGWFADASSVENIVAAIREICSTSNAELYAKAQNSYRLGSTIYTEKRAVLAYESMIAEASQ